VCDCGTRRFPFVPSCLAVITNHFCVQFLESASDMLQTHFNNTD
jgi:hypothetical protein